MLISRKNSNYIFYTLLYTIIIVASITFMIPFVWLVRSSFMNMAQIFKMPPKWIPDPFILSNYPHAMKAVPFDLYFMNTLKIVVFNVAGSILTSSLAAFGFSRLRWRHRDLVFGVILTSMMLPFGVTIIPTFLGWKMFDLIDTFYPLIIPAWFGGGAFNIFLLRQFYLTIPHDLDESARVDGASYLRIYSQIILPLSKPALITVSLFTFLNHWNDFLGPLIFLTTDKKYTLSLGLRQFQGYHNAEWDLMMAASVIVTLPAIVLFLIGQKYFIKGIAMTGLKS